MKLLPRLCSYHIPIANVSCGAKHTAFVTCKIFLFNSHIATNLCYTIGSNTYGQLGISDMKLDLKCSPVLVESLVNYKVIDVSCGQFHTIVLTHDGEAFAWGSNKFGQCGSSSEQVLHEPE